MSNVGVWTAQSNVEPISTATIGGIANMAQYVVANGCAPTYSAANLNVTIASGAILYGGTFTAVAGASVALVADPTNPRWSWVGINSSGTPTLVSGTAAATPSVPDVGNMVPITLVYVQAALTIADNATYKLDKRVFLPGTVQLAGLSTTPTSTTSTSAVDLITISGLSIATTEPFRVEHNFAKTATNANRVCFGIKINSTTVVDATAAGSCPRTSATNQVEDGIAIYSFTPRSAAYLAGVLCSYTSRVSASGANAVAPLFMASDLTALIPNAAITSLAIRALNDTNNNNAAVGNVRVLTGVS